MANYSKLDLANTVIDAIYLSNDYEAELGGESGVNTWATTNFGGDKWLKTSFNTHLNENANGGVPFRKNYGGIGMTYNADIDGFVFDRPFDSWILNATIGAYEAPTARPSDTCHWDEDTASWISDPVVAEDTEQSVLDNYEAALNTDATI